MATTVNSAFNEFLRDSVNLNPDDTKGARRSRDWLYSQIDGLPGKDSTFPALYAPKHINYGSLARKTKKRPLDDVDIMICLDGMGSYYLESADGITIIAGDNATNLQRLCFEGSTSLNSRRVINKFVSSLSNIPQYQNSDIKRNEVAAVLKLKSYPWSFDIVPCFLTTEDAYGRTYYLIPDGYRNWQKTDPRKDRSRVSTINQRQGGNALNAIRTLKYWNYRPTMPSMSSYMMENMVLDYYEKSGRQASSYVDMEIPYILDYIQANIHCSVNDPKEIQGDINTLTYEQREKIRIRAVADYWRANKARQLEANEDYRASINKWREIFGHAFPTYG